MSPADYGKCLRVSVIVSVATAMLPAASRAVIVIEFVPVVIGMVTLQLVVPVATPLPPALFVHATCVTPTLSELVPLTVTDAEWVEYVADDVGPVIVRVGNVVSAGGVVDIVTASASFARLPAASRA